jgi:hypothetical protein
MTLLLRHPQSHAIQRRSGRESDNATSQEREHGADARPPGKWARFLSRLVEAMGTDPYPDTYY